MLYANAAAHRLAGGALTLGVPAEEYPRAYRLYDASGRALDARRDARRARGARRDAAATSRSTGTRRAACAPCSCRASTIALEGGRRVTVVTFEDVTALEGARRRSSLLADELRVMLDNVADAITVQSPDHKLIYANEAAARHYGIPRRRGGWRIRRRRATCGASRRRTTLGRPLDLARLPGRLALAGLDPEPVVVRSRDRETGRDQLGADQGDRRARPRRRRAAGDQRHRGHHRAQALRGVPALPGRGVAAALGLLAGLRADAGGGGRAGGARARRPLRGRPRRRRRRVRRRRSRSCGPARRGWSPRG